MINSKKLNQNILIEATLISNYYLEIEHIVKI